MLVSVIVKTFCDNLLNCASPSILKTVPKVDTPIPYKNRKIALKLLKKEKFFSHRKLRANA